MTIVLVLVTLLLALPWAGAAVARRLAVVLPPRWACWSLTGAALLLAGGTVSALVGLFHVPLLAVLERLPLSRVRAEWPAAVPIACAAGAAMLVQLVMLVRRWLGHRSLLRRAWLATGGSTVDGDLLVVPGADVDAFALPAYRGRPGRVVVTSGMVRALKPGEREVLLAHERAHLAGRHHLLSAVVDLAAVVHPAVGGLRGALGFHLERWADEDAAAVVGDRRTAAAAIARAALKGSSRSRPDGYPLLSATSGPVPQRVQALLLPKPVAPRGGVRRAGALAMGTLVASVAIGSLALAYGLHEYVEYASSHLLGTPSGCSGLWGALEDLLGSGTGRGF
ncbi:M56 family metallopeptidase [Streptomyces sp. NPDC101490]|uniref:M56 family metallopeptidase n=1 Tax=Streptomyces sp. NPDC101490 TaxID=3366143 RepID=UPI0038220D0F